VFTDDTVYTVTITDTVGTVKGFLAILGRKPLVAVDKERNMGIIKVEE
jgi:hypothetical protein